MATNATTVVEDFLGNTAPDKIEAAAARLVAEDAEYVSLNFDNPLLKQVLPWAGSGTGRKAYVDTFLGVWTWWTIESFSAEALFGDGEDVAVFGSFTYRANATGERVTSPMAIHAKVRDGQIVYFLFMEDTFATAGSFRTGGTWTIRTDPDGAEFEV